MIPTRSLRSFLIVALRACFAIASISLVQIFSPSAFAAIVTTGNVTPDPSTTVSSSTLYVGQTATGTMTVNGGSVVTSGFSYMGYNAGVTGTVTITDSGSKWNASTINAGYSGAGNLTVSNGGTVSGSIVLGDDDTAFGTLTVTGNGSLVTGGYVDVGEFGPGTMNVSAGGKVSSTSGSIGIFDNGTATIDGVGSSWTMSSLSMGFDAKATLTVQNGALLSSSSASISDGSNLQSTLTVTGAGSVWNNSGALAVGSFSGLSVVNINQAATVNAGGDTTVGSLSPTGVMSFDGGTLNTGGLLTRPSDLHGTGTINTHGLVSDVNLVFDQNNGLQKQIIFTDGGSQNITVNLDQSAAGSLGAGYGGAGTLTIAGGVVVNSRNGVLGFASGSNGIATVNGPGSKWTMTGNLTVSNSGTATLNITNGGVVEVGQTMTITVSNVSNSGNIVFDNGTLTTRSLLAGTNQLGGTGAIYTHGLVSDFAIILDQTHPLQQQIILNGLPNQNVTINLDIDGTGIMGAGFRGIGSLTVADGKTLNSPLGYLGYGSGSNGSAIVDGLGTTWTIAGRLSIGSGGFGSLFISNGATVADFDGQLSKGKVTVTGSGSSWNNSNSISIGSSSGILGEVVVINGGKVISASPFSPVPGSGLGIDFGSNGKATIDGTGSVWNHTGSFTIGGGGTGTLTISGGGKFTSAGGIVGNGTSSGSGNVTVAGAGSIWSNSGTISVGNGAHGNLMVSNGGTVTNTSASIGASFGPSSTGAATVTGPGSTWTNSSALTVGGDGPGTLTVSDGGVVTSTTGAVGKYFSGSSSANVSGPGSKWNMSGAFAVGGYFFSSGSPVSGGAGTLTIGTGGTVQTGGDTTIFSQGRINLQGGTLTTPAIKFQFSTSGVFSWTGGMLHVGTFNGNLTNSAGTLSPGSSPGKTTITGTYTQQSSASLDVEIGGTTSVTQYDLVAITGNTTLGGLLKLSLLNGFLPSFTDSFTVLTSGGTLSGSFGNVATGQRLTTTDGIGSFLVTYTPNSKQVVLSAFQAVPEPSAAILIAFGFCAACLSRRRR